MEIIKASLLAALQQDGGGGSYDICDWIESLPSMSGGALANNYYFYIRYGIPDKPTEIYYYEKASSSYPALCYKTEETHQYHTYACIYKGSTNELMCALTAYNTFYYQYDSYSRIYGDPVADTFCRYERRFNSFGSYGAPTVTYSPSSPTSNGGVRASISLSFPYTLLVKEYSWNSQTHERQQIGQSTSSYTGGCGFTVPEVTYNYPKYSRLSDAEYRQFCDDFTQDVIDYISQ